MAARLFKGAEFLLTQATKADVFTPEDFTEDQRQIANTTSAFVEEEVLPVYERLEHQEAGLAAALMRKAGDAGLLMIDVPEAYGGLELDKVTSVLAADRMGAAGAFSVSFSAHTGIGTLPLVYYGTEAQKQQYLPKIASGEWSAAYCLTEPGAGSDALGGTATAVLSPDGKHYLLDGTKQFITNGGFAELFTVFAKIDRKHFTAFLVERSYEGVTIGPEEKKLGIKGSSTTSVILEGAKVPVENVLGEIGKGHKIAFNVLNVGRFKLGAAVNGAGRYAFGDRRGLREPAQAVRRAHLELRRDPREARRPRRRLLRLRVARVPARRDDRRPARAPLEGHAEVLGGLPGRPSRSTRSSAPSRRCSAARCSRTSWTTSSRSTAATASRRSTRRSASTATSGSTGSSRGRTRSTASSSPGTILRRALKGELPVQQEAMRALDAMMTPSMDELDRGRPVRRREGDARQHEEGLPRRRRRGGPEARREAEGRAGGAARARRRRDPDLRGGERAAPRREDRGRRGPPRRTPSPGRR